MTPSRRIGLALAVPAALLAFAGCSSDDDTTSTDTTETTGSDSGSSSGGEASESGIEVTGAWARSSPAMADAGAAYLTITSEDADAIVGASVPASVAGTVELHETVSAPASE